MVAKYYEKDKSTSWERKNETGIHKISTEIEQTVFPLSGSEFVVQKRKE